MKQSLPHTGFTLIELIVVITIFFIVFMTTYVPYSYYQTKQQIKTAAKEVAQSLYEARNFAINGYDQGGNNQSIGVVFDAENTKDSIKILSYPFSFSGSEVTLAPSSTITLVKEIKLPQGLQIDTIGGKKKALFFFQSISGSGSYYSIENSGLKQPFTEESIDILISFRGATTQNLQKKVSYYTPTNIVDY